MPTQLVDLPLELLPQLLAPLVSRRDLVSASLVCRAWRPVAQRLLLRHVRLFGRDLAIAPLLFLTLVDHPHLAAMVRKLEVRVYPLSMKLRERQAMEDLAIRMLANCVAVEDLVWTRKGALTDRVFEAIVALPKLRSFECNAHTNLSPGSWDAEHFLDLPPLRSLSLILPDRNVANLLPAFLAKQRSLSATSSSADDDHVLLLEELSILCRESTVINDRVVAALAPSLANSHLTSLALAGCAKLTGAPLLDLLPTLPHLRHLALEACNLDPSSFFPAAAPHLAALESLKLTHPGPGHPSLPAFFPALEALLDHTHALTALTLYHSGASTTGRREWPVVPLEFVRHVALAVGARLRKFEVSGVLVGVEAVEALTAGARELRNLVLHLGQDFDLPRLTASFAPLASLRTLHLLSQRADIGPDDVLSLAEQCSPTLRQIGFRNRVWLVRRTYSPAPDAPAKVSLAPYDLPWFPEALLVVRFVETAGAFGAFRRNRYGAESDVESEVESGDEGVGSGSGSGASASEDEDE